MASLIYVIILIVIGILHLWDKFSKTRSFLKKHPLVVFGGGGYCISWKTSLQYFFRWPEVMIEGYSKYNAYQIPTLRGFLTFLNNPADIQDYFSAPENVLSLLNPLSHELQIDYTLPGTLNRESQAYLSSHARRTLGESKLRYDAIAEEIDVFLRSDIEPAIEGGRVCVSAFKLAVGASSQADNRIFVGKKLCRNKEYLDGVVNWAEHMAIGGQIIKLFPQVLKPFAARYFTRVVTQRFKFEEIMEPIVHERVKILTSKSTKSSPSIENGYLDSLIQGILNRNRGVVDPATIARLMLAVNTAALHTSSQVLTTAIYELAQRPELCELLRREFLQKVGSSTGYENAAAVVKELPMLDSFFKEVGRMYPPGHSTSFREVLKEFTFSSGLRVPVGATVSVPTLATYRDPQLYPDPDTFDPLRFVKKGTDDKTQGSFTDTSVSSYVFSHGVHVCPGRWLASASMKLTVIKLIERYEIRLEEGKPKPSGLSFQASFIQDMKSKIELRERRSAKEVSQALLGLHSTGKARSQGATYSLGKGGVRNKECPVQVQFFGAIL